MVNASTSKSGSPLFEALALKLKICKHKNMLAIIRTGSKQYKVQVGSKIKVEKIEAKEGDKISFNEVLLVGTDSDVQVGQPLVKGAKVEATVLSQGKADKVTLIKHKSKKRYLKKQGHRQLFTQVEITDIAVK